MAKNKEVINEGGLETKDNDTNAGNTLHPGAGVVGSEPRHKILQDIIDAAGGIETGDLSKFRDSLVMNKGENQSKTLNGKEAVNKGSIVPHASDAVNKHVKEDIVAMFTGQELNEETIDKMVTMFEASVSARVLVEATRLQEEHDAKLTEEVKTVTEEITQHVNKYLTYAAEEWTTSNKVAIREELQVEITKDFMSGLKQLFKEHYIKVPNGKVDVLKELADENASLEAKLNEQMNKNIELTKTITEGKKAAVVEEVSAGLSELSKTKFRTLCESVEYGDDYKIRVEAIKTELTKVPASKSDTGIVSDGAISPETLNEEIKGASEVKLDPAMKAYVDATMNVKN